MTETKPRKVESPKQRPYNFMNSINVDRPDQEGLITDFLKSLQYRPKKDVSQQEQEMHKFLFISKNFQKFKNFVYNNTELV